MYKSWKRWAKIVTIYRWYNYIAEKEPRGKLLEWQDNSVGKLVIKCNNQYFFYIRTS